MSARSILTLRDAIVGKLRVALPQVSVEPHGGAFDVDELKRVAALAPAIRVAIIGARSVKPQADGSIALPLDFAAVLMTKDTAMAGQGVTRRDTAALALGSALAVCVNGNRWGVRGVGAPAAVTLRNEFSGEIDNLGVALWQLTWTQDLLLGADRFEAIGALSALWINDAPFAGANAPEGSTAPGDAP